MQETHVLCVCICVKCKDECDSDIYLLEHLSKTLRTLHIEVETN